MTYDPSLRVLTVLELLQAHETVTGAELARRLEVSPRTVQRYILRLQDLGIPVEGRRGVGGAYRLKPGFRLPPLMFSGQEALALALGLLALRQLGLSDLLPAADAAGSKLRRVLPPDLRAEMQALGQVVQLDSSPWVVGTDARLLSTLFQAAREGRQTELVYHAAQNSPRDNRKSLSDTPTSVGLTSVRPPSIRQVEVYRVVHLDGRWYAVGRCLLRGALRCFRLDRIEHCRLLDTTFSAPGDFDALAFLQRELPPGPQTHAVSVWLAAPPQQLRGHVSVWQTDLQAEAEGTRLKARRENLTSFAAFLLGLGVEFRVDAPPELSETLRTIGERAARAGQTAMDDTTLAK